ncbi:rRNA methyltransferase [Longibacter salinarum]|uniref:tRNA (guanosine(18)-2'-O)-methyltransferase n=2 Tax=Longibacter salinarum TaxID=1850348 RepID=A0A2A8CZP5_9BACT|nr:rRNA methyltransferase [Longibacter salinarum]
MQQLLAAGGRPPHRDRPFDIAGRELSPTRIIELLTPFMTERRMRRIREVVGERTRTVLPVVEGLVNTGNVSAVMRSAEALGYQDVHVVKGSNEKRYKHSKRTTQGAQHWLDVWRWPDADAFVRAMHDSGYRVVVTALREDAKSIREVDFTRPTALVVGNELEGASDAMLELADEAAIIPLNGFTESFNVSVAASIGLYHAREDRIRRQGHHADLSQEEQEALVARFCLRSVTNAESIIERVLSDLQSS